MGSQDIMFNRIRNDFHLLSKVVMKQLSLSKELFSDDKGCNNGNYGNSNGDNNGDGNSNNNNNSKELLAEITSNEGIIDSIEVKLRSEVINTIVLYSPRAIDLRKIIAYYDMTAYMERIGDHLLNISEELVAINKKGVIFANNIVQIKELFSTVELMTHNALFAFECEDNALAKRIITDDHKADNLNREILSQLTIMQDNSIMTSSDISDIIQIGALSSNLERIGDNATNIAESAIYITEGRDIKHHD